MAKEPENSEAFLGMFPPQFHPLVKNSEPWFKIAWTQQEQEQNGPVGNLF